MKTEQNTTSSISLPVLYSSLSGKRERLAVEATWHDYDELIYFQEGEFQLYLNLKEKLIKEESLYFIPRGCFHRLYATSDKAVQHSLCFRLEDFSFAEGDFLEQDFFGPLRNGSRFFPEDISLRRCKAFLVWCSIFTSTEQMIKVLKPVRNIVFEVWHNICTSVRKCCISLQLWRVWD